MICSSEEDTDGWVKDILDHIEDETLWSKAVSNDTGHVITPSINNNVKRRKIKQRTASKLLLFYNRISSGDLMESNLLRNDRIVRNRN